jgi:tetratricopeptide (TPR) repeat protein
MKNPLIAFSFAILGAMGTAESAPYPVNESTCGSLYGMGIGPLDYQSAPGTNTILLVESAHFTPGVESLSKGSTGSFGGDLDYTLRAYPNHYRALFTMSRLQFKEKKTQPYGARWPVACYFERALRWRPNDPNVRLVYGIHLFKDGKRKDSVEQLEQAISLGLDTGNAHYNLGLALFETGDMGRSVQHAVRAYRLGFSLPALKTKLQKAGKWPSPEEEERIAQSFAKDEVEAPSPEKALPEIPDNSSSASN